jgi:hypothetical protein
MSLSNLSPKVFSRIEEGIGMKLGTYVPINVVSKCWDLSADRKFKMATIRGERLHPKKEYLCGNS